MFRKLTYSFLLLCCCLLTTTALSAQRNCGSMEVLEEQIRQDPTRLDRMQEIERFTAKFDGSAEKAVVTIPVVVHVVYRTAAENISTAQIQSQLDVLNADFRRLNSDADGTWSQAADSEIEFCLASVDPNGNATSGIIRKSTTVNGFGTNDRVKNASQGGSNAWPAADYLNIWVCNIGGGILGYAQFPGGPASTDGVVCGSTYFGTTGTAQAPFNLGRTMTHEVGHYLNLRHIWGDGGCGASDFVADTPDSDGPNYGCATGTVSCSTTDMVQNYMDYSDDGCMNLFTAGQNNRMNALFAPGGFRASLLNSGACGGGGGNPDPDPVCNDTEVTFQLTTDNYGSETTWSLTGNGVSFSGGPYGNNQTITETFCLPDGCYDFQINDSYGDGICCAYGNGSYSVTGGGSTLASGGSFTSSETTNFCIGGGNPPTPTCTDGIQNGNETGVDCGGSCAPCNTGGGCTESTVFNSGFESGYGIWNDGGSDCIRTSTFSRTGGFSVYLRDNTSTSVVTTDPIDLSGVDEVELGFYYRARSMENGEDFWLQVSVGGGAYQTLQTWAAGTDFVNSNSWTQESVTITGNFGNSARFRFRCDASGNSDYIYLDDITLDACIGNGRTLNPLAAAIDRLGGEDVREDDGEEVTYQVFPNPARRSFNIRIDEEGYTARLTSVEGRTLLSRQLTAGTNVIQTAELPRGMYLLILEGADGYREVEKVILTK